MNKRTQKYFTYFATAALLLMFAGQASAQTMRATLLSSMPADDPYCGSSGINTDATSGVFSGTLSPCEDITLSVGQGATGGNTDFPEGVVDWVLVEVRNAANSAAALPATVVARKPALLLTNGRVVDAELFIALGTAEKTACLATTVVDEAAAGCPQVSLGTGAFGAASPTIADRAFLVVYHRNHLGIQGNNPITLASNAGSYDFSAARAQTVGIALTGIKSVTTLATGTDGVLAMRMGDANGDGQVQTTDATFDILGSTTEGNRVGDSGYSLLDINMDNQIQSTDATFDILGSRNPGSGSQVRK